MAQDQLTVVGRASPGGPVDDLTLTAGRWARQPGEIVLERDRVGPAALLGTQVTVTGVPGSPRLTVVGLASSVTGTGAGLGDARRAGRRCARRARQTQRRCSTASPAPEPTPR